MNSLTYLLYILSLAVKPTPKLITNLGRWLTNNQNFDLANFKLELFCRILDLSLEQSQRFHSAFNAHSIESYSSQLKQYEIQTINLVESSYPSLLLQIPDPPLVLYIKGCMSGAIPVLAIVGNRKITSYGKIACKKLVEELAGHKFAIVSGLAYGVDALSHELALSNELYTIAVLPTGLDDESLYPKSNFKLAKTILKHGGALVSEYPPGTTAQPFQFVARNRIIAGLAHATAIIECELKSGALITADFALDYNRTVFAVPGSIFSKHSEGTNHLLKLGATPLTCGDDVIKFFGLEKLGNESKSQIKISELEQRVLECMKTDRVNFDELLSATNLDIGSLQAVLTNLELKKLVSQTGSQTFTKLT